MLQFTQFPVYVFHLDDPKQAGGYVIPPKPGILAFLQQRHHLNLHSRVGIIEAQTFNPNTVKPVLDRHLWFFF